MADKFRPTVTAALMDCIPPFGWHEIATKHDLAALDERMDQRFRVVDYRFDAVEERIGSLDERIDLKLDARFHAAEARIIRWTVASVFGGIASISGAVAVVTALVS